MTTNTKVIATVLADDEGNVGNPESMTWGEWCADPSWGKYLIVEHLLQVLDALNESGSYTQRDANADGAWSVAIDCEGCTEDLYPLSDELTEKIAREFARRIAEYVEPKGFAGPWTLWSLSEVCDPNQFGIDAFTAVMGRKPVIGADEADLDAIENAMDWANDSDFWRG